MSHSLHVVGGLPVEGNRRRITSSCGTGAGCIGSVGLGYIPSSLGWLPHPGFLSCQGSTATCPSPGVFHTL